MPPPVIHIWGHVATSYDHVLLILIAPLSTGSPNCPNTQIRDITEDSLVVSVQQLHRMWLPVCYHVKVTFYNMSVVTANNWSCSGDGSVPVTSLQPGKVYNISVTPCNMAGCNESCDIHSIQTLGRSEICTIVTCMHTHIM